MKIYNVYQSGKRLYIDEKENPDNKIVVNKYDNMQQTLRLISDGTLPPRLYWALRNPKLSNKYFILKLVNNEDLIVGTDISATPGLWDMLLIGTDEDYIIEGTDIDQSRLTYVSDHFGRLFVRDNFLEELDFEEQCSPTFKIFYDEIMFSLENKAEMKDIPDQLSDLENDTNFISGVTFKDDGEGHVEIIGTTFSSGETEEGGGSGGNVEVDDKLDEESTNPVQNKVVTKEIKTLKDKDESLDKEVNTLKEHNTQLKETIEKLQIKQTTDKAPFHHITDSANMKVLDFGMEGKTEQKTVAGNQLFDKNTVPLLNELLQNDGIPSPSPNISFAHTDFIEVLPNETYTIACLDSKYISTGIYSYDDNKTFISIDKTYTGFVTPTNTKYIMIGFCKSTYDTFTNEDLLKLSDNIMLVKGSTKPTAYEPYTNGPSPNPDYPQEIVNAGVYNEETGRYEHKFGFVNGNLLPSDHNEWFLNHGSSWGTRPGTKPSIDRGYTYNSCIIIDVRPDTPICFHNDTTDKYWVSRIIEIDNDGIGLSYIGLYGNESYNFKDYSFKTSSKTHKLIIDVRLVDKTQTFTEADLQEMKIAFGYGDSVTYTPHQSQQFTLTSPVPLTKWDYLTKRDGVWGWSIWSEYLNINGDSGWVASNGNKGFYCECLPTHYSTQDAYCNQLINDPMRDNTVNGLWVGSGNKCVYARPSAFFDNTLSDFGLVNWKTHLNENPLDIWYQTTEEQAFHPLLEEEQTLLNNLETYYGVTNLYNEQGCPMWLCYTCDSKLYVDKKLEQINNALLSLGANV